MALQFQWNNIFCRQIYRRETHASAYHLYMSPTPPRRRPLTERALKYGVITVPSLAPSGKSGLSPVDRPQVKDTRSLSPTGIKERARFIKYQRDSLFGFATWELQDQDCYENVAAKPSNLSMDTLHPLVIQKRWKMTQDPLDIGDGIAGKWDAQNPVVWEVLRPILAIVTRILTNTDFWLWYDTCLHGERKKLEEDACDADGSPRQTLYSVHPRKPEEAFPDMASIKHVFVKMKAKVAFVIEHRLQRAYGEGIVNASHWPRADTEGFYQKAYILVHYRHLEVLLKQNLTISERLVQQFFIAKTLIHEISHAANSYANSMSAPIAGLTGVFDPEPFFHDEEINELGHSSEVAIWGGSIGSSLHTRVLEKGTPALCLNTRNWPNWLKHWKDGISKKKNLRYRYHERMGKGARADFWPIQIKFVENMQQEDYWESQVRIFKGQALRPKRIYGHGYARGNPAIQKAAPDNLILIGPDCSDWIKAGNTLQALRVHTDADLVVNGEMVVPAGLDFNISRQKIDRALLRQHRKKVEKKRKKKTTVPAAGEAENIQDKGYDVMEGLQRMESSL